MPDRLRSLHLTAGALLAALLIAPAAAGAPPVGVLSTTASDGPIAAYGDTVAWNSWDDDAHGYRVMVARDAAVRTLPVEPAPAPLALSAGPGPGGATWLVWSRCDADERTSLVTACDVEAYDLDADRPQPLPFAARPRVLERAPSIWRTRLAYVTGRNLDVARVHLADVDGDRDRVVGAVPQSACALSIVRECATTVRATVQSTALSADRLAVGSRVSTAAGDIGICGLATVGVLELETGALRRIDSTVCGLAGQQLEDLAFDDAGRLWWRQSCNGDTGACEGAGTGPFRLTSGSGVERLRPGLGSRLAGIAVAGSTLITDVLAPGSPPECFADGTRIGAYRCGTLSAVAPGDVRDGLRRVPDPDDDLPPSGYVTVRGTSAVRVLAPPERLPCTRGSALRPRPGAELWAATSWYRKGQPAAGPAMGVTARSGDREVRGQIAAETAARPVQHTVTLDLGGPARACDRRWTLTYRVAGEPDVRFTVDVQPG